MKKQTQTKKTTKQQAPDTLVVLLLDNTGSMQACKLEALSGYNAYFDSLRKEQLGNLRISVVQFNSIITNPLYNDVLLDEVKPMTDAQYLPVGNTPLYDAMGKLMESTEAKAKKRKVLFVTLTDGEENSSSRWTLAKLQAKMKQCEKKLKWTFVHLGVGAAGWEALQTVARGTQSFANVLKTRQKDLKRSMARAAAGTMSYASSMDQEVVMGFWKGKP